ncbi:hypothetical protein GCM10022223_01130 [Kineosporia mesophila]|uniref:Uncharacterized protein n=1 Tax=Kineosporia mesophila TaxID=566012 RepID=A0ABP6YU87_9ACTN
MVSLPGDAGHEAVGQSLLIAGVGVGALAAAALGRSVVHDLTSFMTQLTSFVP